MGDNKGSAWRRRVVSRILKVDKNCQALWNCIELRKFPCNYVVPWFNFFRSEVFKMNQQIARLNYLWIEWISVMRRENSKFPLPAVWFGRNFGGKKRKHLLLMSMDSNASFGAWKAQPLINYVWYMAACYCVECSLPLMFWCLVVWLQAVY